MITIFTLTTFVVLVAIARHCPSASAEEEQDQQYENRDDRESAAHQ
ncbi:hypothetical protein ABIE89_000426 [Bradyrhizobium niftali]